MNVIARLEYELAYYDSAVHRFNHYTTRTHLNREGDCWKTLRLATGLCAMPHKQENAALARRKVMQPHDPNIWPPLSLVSNPFDSYVWGTVKQETNKATCNTKDKQKARLTAVFTNLNKILWKRFRRLPKIRKSSGGRDWSHWRFLRINWIYNISRYFYLILVNTLDKVTWCQCYFQYCRLPSRQWGRGVRLPQRVSQI